jgi:hypothetical protein
MTDEQPSRGGRRGRGTDAAQIVVISWRDIPAQVNAQKGRDREQVILSAKFQRAIDRAKRKANIYTAHEDIAQWKRESRPCGEDLAAEAAAEAALLESRYTKEHLGRLGFLGGWEPANHPDGAFVETSLSNHDDDEDPEDDPEGAEDDQSSDWGTWSVSPPAAEASASDSALPNDMKGTTP